MSHLHKEHQDNSLYDDKESISLENPELFGNHNIYQEDETKDEKKPGKEEVEGEVDLGEDVGPDEDIDQGGYENDQPEVSNHKFNDEENDRIKDYDDDNDILIHRLKHSANVHEQKYEGEDDNQDSDEEGHYAKDEEDTLEDEGKYISEDDENESAQDSEIENSDEDSEQRKNNTEEEVMKSNEDDYDPETSESKHKEVMLVVHPIVQPETAADIQPIELEKPLDQIVDTSNTDAKVANPKRRGFFYHFQHTIPRPTERIEQAVERGLQSAASIKIPPSAMHDPQLSYHYINKYQFPQV